MRHHASTITQNTTVFGTSPGGVASAALGEAATLPLDPSAFRQAVLEHLLCTCAKDACDAEASDLYRAMAHAVRDRLVHRWLDTQRTYYERDVKYLYYLSSEFLTGRSLGLCLLNIGLYGVAERIAAERDLDLDDVLECEQEPGLGNGGLGRLAACFMDSLATLALPAIGYGIRYEYGLFEQSIEAGQQVERRDRWLKQGNPWELPKYEHAQVVKLYGHVEQRCDAAGRLVSEWVGAREVIGIPYDSFVVGHAADNVNTLRLWAARTGNELDLSLFDRGDYLHAVAEKVEVENISRVLYPNDTTPEGKELRLKQQYFFVACSIGDILRRFKQTGHPWEKLPERAAIQLNDTHPAIAVAELMRVLVDEEGLDWERAFRLVESTFGYTNHTLLSEALECWPVGLFERLLPRHLTIIYRLNQQLLATVAARFPGDEARLRRMSIIEEGEPKRVRMAYLATFGSHSINGVAKLHSDLVKRELLRDFFELWPERFNNKTNGITPRRWLLYANPALARLLTRRLGGDWLPHELAQLARFREHAEDSSVLDALQQIKLANKQRLSVLVRQRTGVELDTSAMFVVQAKRIHEYKRQLLACLAILAHYTRLRAEPGVAFTPRCYIFSGKAAASYEMAKLTIRLINDIAALVNADPVTRGRLQAVFLPNYGVTMAQTIIPAADLSLQISLAGKEASGTSNMKLALNGALTLGTLDGANVEIRDAVGPEHFFAFGLTVDAVSQLWPSYDPASFIAKSPRLSAALELLESGLLSDGDRSRYAPFVRQLREQDPYMTCADFDAYLAAEDTAATTYLYPRAWQCSAVFNIAGASAFSSDDTVRAYAREIWSLTAQTPELTSRGTRGLPLARIVDPRLKFRP